MVAAVIAASDGCEYLNCLLLGLGEQVTRLCKIALVLKKCNLRKLKTHVLKRDCHAM